MSRFSRTLIILIFLVPQIAYSIVGSKRAGKGWEAIVYIEFYFSKNTKKTSCTGFLINDSQIVTVGHCAIQDETGIKAKSASVCIGSQRPFSNPGEGCFQSKRIRFAKNYQYNTHTDMSIIDLNEEIPLNFLGIKPIELLTGNEALQYLKRVNTLPSNKLRIVSFGSRNFNAPSLGKKGWVNVTKLYWDRISGLWQAKVKGAVYGQSDDGAGLLIKTATGWKLSGLMLNATPDFFISVQPLFDPCLPPDPAPRQPDIKLSSEFQFVSMNSLACNNRFFSKSISNNKFCEQKPLSSKQLIAEADNLDAQGVFAFERLKRARNSSQKLKWLNKAAKRGHTEAMLRLSEKYFNGDGLRQNKKKAIKLIENAAKKSSANAQYRIALLIKQGNPKNNTSLEGSWSQWMRKSAEQGHAAAQFEYALYLSNKKQSSQVYDWLMRSARQGYAPAQLQLGENFYYGYGVKKDRYIGQQWIEFAAGQANISASNFMQTHPRVKPVEY